MMEVPAAFRSRRPPTREVSTKLCVLITFSVFCAAVSFRVKDMPLPSGMRLDDGVAQPTEEPDVFTFPTFSLEEKAKIAQLSARIPVPYFVPWGADERPAVFFMWHLLYRSLKPDLNQLASRLLQDNTTTSVVGETTKASTASAVVTDAARNSAKLTVVIQVLETQDGYITASLVHYLPQAYVYSVVVNASTEALAAAEHHRGSHRRRGGRGPLLPDALLTERRKFSEAVAAKVERVLSNPQSEKVAEASHQPGINGVLPTLEPGGGAAAAVGSGEAKGTAAPAKGPESVTEAATALTVASPRLFLCIPHSGLNTSYVTSAAAEKLRVHYQVILFPYTVLQRSTSPSIFDAALRSLLLQANVATFIALPLLEDGDAAATPDENTRGKEALSASAQQRHVRHAAFRIQELVDYDVWYAEEGPAPGLVLQRVLGVPEITDHYHVSIGALGSKRWAGALRQLYRVELREKTHTVPTATETPGAGALNGSSTTTAPPASASFGCLARQRLLGCMARPLHTRCDSFSDARLS